MTRALESATFSSVRCCELGLFGVEVAVDMTDLGLETSPVLDRLVADEIIHDGQKPALDARKKPADGLHHEASASNTSCNAAQRAGFRATSSWPVVLLAR